MSGMLGELSQLLQSLLAYIYPISGYIIAGILLLILSGWLGFFSALQLGNWGAMWQPVDVVHQEVPAASEQVFVGTLGCLLGVPARILQWICFFVGIDLILFQGRASMWVAEAIGAMVESVI